MDLNSKITNKAALIWAIASSLWVKYIKICVFASVFAWADISCAESYDCRAEMSWKILWEHFYCPKTSMFYDYVNSWSRGEEFKYFPTPKEISKNIPTPIGYGTGMENAGINADLMMIATIAKYNATSDSSLADSAKKIFDGIWNCVMAHQNPGFVLRGKCPFDASSYYPVSSRDQVTEVVNAAFLYHQFTPSSAEKLRAGRLLRAIADHQMRTVKAENGYNFLDAYGKLQKWQRAADLSKMWEVAPHEAARLPMVYIAAYAVSKDQKYLREYTKYSSAALEQTLDFSNKLPPWAHWQMHLSIRLIWELTPNEDERNICANILSRSKSLGLKRISPALKRWSSLPDNTKYMLAPNWRSSDKDLMKRWRQVWFASEAPAYAAMTVACGTEKMSKEEANVVRGLLEQVQYDKIAGQAMIYYLALYYISCL